MVKEPTLWVLLAKSNSDERWVRIARGEKEGLFRLWLQTLRHTAPPFLSLGPFLILSSIFFSRFSPVSGSWSRILWRYQFWVRLHRRCLWSHDGQVQQRQPQHQSSLWKEDQGRISRKGSRRWVTAGLKLQEVEYKTAGMHGDVWLIPSQPPFLLVDLSSFWPFLANSWSRWVIPIWTWRGWELHASTTRPDWLTLLPLLLP